MNISGAAKGAAVGAVVGGPAGAVVGGAIGMAFFAEGGIVDNLFWEWLVRLELSSYAD